MRLTYGEEVNTHTDHILSPTSTDRPYPYLVDARNSYVIKIQKGIRLEH